MDDSNKLSYSKNQPQLGMSAFGPAQREQFGQNVRLAMACIESPPLPVKGCALPQDETAIRQRLKALSQEITSNHADLLELLVRFDDLQGWKSSGASHCAAWMNVEIGISVQLSWEYLRVGRKLQKLPTVKALFRVGKLSWSKVRLITRVADSDNEKTLCHSTLDASVSDVQQLCEAYKWSTDGDDKADNERVLQQWASRALTWNEASNGCTRIQLVLPPETAQAFLNSVEHSLNQLDDVGSTTTDTTLSQSRADAAVLMAENSLQNAGKAIASADRYQVSVSIDASDLAADEVKIPSLNPVQARNPKKRPTLNGVGPIAKETARRIACDCSLSINKTDKSEPIDIGRKSRIWPSAMARFIKERDQQCVWPGCTHSRHLHIHHLKHWADGGETSERNGVCLCSYHHTRVHEGGYTIEHVASNTLRLHEQFTQQQNNDDIGLFDFEKSLRNDRESFDTVRKLSPNRFRYRILDAQGRVISGRSTDDVKIGPEVGLHAGFACVVNNKEACENTNDTTHVEQAKFLRVDSSKAARANTNDTTHVEQAKFLRVDSNKAARANTNDTTHVEQAKFLRVDSNKATRANTNDTTCEEQADYTHVGSGNSTPINSNQFSTLRCTEPVPDSY